MKAPSPKLFAAIAATLVLTGCPSSPTEVRTVHPSCTQCGISATLHRDGGTKVWSASNDTDAPMAMPVSISRPVPYRQARRSAQNRYFTPA
jgi:hypothetical protein